MKILRLILILSYSPWNIFVILLAIINCFLNLFAQIMWSMKIVSTAK